MKREREGQHGNVYIWKWEDRKAYPSDTECVNLPIWSRGKSPWNKLSPFYLKTESGEIFENVWQSYKVYPKVKAQHQPWCEWRYPEEVHYANDTVDMERWTKWHKAVRTHPRALRRPNGTEKPVFALYEGERLGIVEARKRIYVPMLQKLYRAHPQYQEALKLVQEHNIILIEPDGPPGIGSWDPDLLEFTHDRGMRARSIEFLKGLQDVTNYKELTEYVGASTDCLTEPKRYFPYGHGYVMALTLLEDLEGVGPPQKK